MQPQRNCALGPCGRPRSAARGLSRPAAWRQILGQQCGRGAAQVVIRLALPNPSMRLGEIAQRPPGPLKKPPCTAPWRVLEVLATGPYAHAALRRSPGADLKHSNLERGASRRSTRCLIPPVTCPVPCFACLSGISPPHTSPPAPLLPPSFPAVWSCARPPPRPVSLPARAFTC